MDSIRMSNSDDADREPLGDEDGMAEWVQLEKVMRIGSMVKELLDEVRNTRLDEASRDRLRKIFELSLNEVSGALSTDLATELGRMISPFDTPVPSESELRIAQAQLIGWLEGLFHGIQAALFAQHVATRQQLKRKDRQELAQGPPSDSEATRTGTYL